MNLPPVLRLHSENRLCSGGMEGRGRRGSKSGASVVATPSKAPRISANENLTQRTSRQVIIIFSLAPQRAFIRVLFTRLPSRPANWRRLESYNGPSTINLMTGVSSDGKHQLLALPDMTLPLLTISSSERGPTRYPLLRFASSRRSISNSSCWARNRTEQETQPKDPGVGEVIRQPGGHARISLSIPSSRPVL